MDTASKLQLLGLTDQKVKETSKNEFLTSVLVSITDQAIKECNGVSGVDRDLGKLLYTLATKLPKQFHGHLPLLTSYLASRKIDQEAKLTAAIKFVQDSVGGSIDKGALEAACGVGVVVSQDKIEATVEAIMEAKKVDIIKQRYKFNIGPLLAEARNKLLWADNKKVKEEFDLQVLTLLGPKTDEDLAKPVKGPKKTAENKEKKIDSKNKNSQPVCNGTSHESEQAGASVPSMLELLRNAPFHKPGENHKTDGFVITPNTSTLLQAHLKLTGGKVRTRFPPEPNGILHIGHAKAININFGYAAAHGGSCFLRYDDTNPEKEEEKFFVGIKDMVEWLGYTPSAITHSSDNFEQLFAWAVQLIESDLAYVCHQRPEEVRGRDPPPSPWRDRPVHESLKLFQDMKRGKFDEGEATLRLKLTLEEGKVDPVAYRIKFVPHHRTGDAWCIYPTYDYTHCLCDSIEHITHSLCTKEFQSRRSSYYWLCNSLNIYCPVQWEYGRLNMDYTVVSKRKIAKLIDTGIVRDWDDPRLFTLSALRRRGFPSEAINRFCASLGLTGAQISIHPDALEATVRDVLNTTAHRTMVVLDPIRVDITNFPSDAPASISVPNIPGNDSAGSHQVTFASTLYIDATDFRESDERGYRRLTPSQGVGLRHSGYVLRVAEAVRGSNNAVESIRATCEPVSPENKPKAFIHWVADPIKCEVRLYDRLFLHECPEDPNVVPGGFLTDINPSSLTVVPDALADRSLLTNVAPFTSYQFERAGFFTVDSDTDVGAPAQRLVFNRTVGLKEDKGKN